MIRIEYDAGADALAVVLAAGKGRIRTQVMRAGVHLDFDEDGRCVALGAARRQLPRAQESAREVCDPPVRMRRRGSRSQICSARSGHQSPGALSCPAFGS
jgi:uncharacterized protein YuzE